MVLQAKKNHAPVERSDIEVLKWSVGENVLVIFADRGKAKMFNGPLVDVDGFRSITMRTKGLKRIPFMGSNSAIRSIYQTTEIDAPGSGILLYHNPVVDNVLSAMYRNGPISDPDMLHALKEKSFGSETANMLRKII